MKQLHQYEPNTNNLATLFKTFDSISSSFSCRPAYIKRWLAVSGLYGWMLCSDCLMLRILSWIVALTTNVSESDGERTCIVKLSASIKL